MALGYRSDIFDAAEKNTLENSNLAHERRMKYDAFSDDDKAVYNTLENARLLLAGEYESDDDEMRLAALTLARYQFPQVGPIEKLNILRGGTMSDFATGAEALQYMVDFYDGKENGVTQEGNAYRTAFNEAKQNGGEAFDADAFDYDYAKQMGFEENPFDESMLANLEGDAAFDEAFAITEDGRAAYKGEWEGEQKYYEAMAPFQAKAQRADMVKRFREHQANQVAFVHRWAAIAPTLSSGANELIRRAAMSGTDDLAEFGGREITLEENAAYQLDRGETAEARRQYGSAPTLGGPGAELSAVREA
jgi:hypothetical protein